ncbi:MULTISPECIES: MarR family winged helix-turn-helix transcriptional regulator [unclassified Lysinibacillus]|uniref:MarR family winged helix-turn-helix transcriptional regulator n=1 Tax=unclassified Lysinibacillus TaxID=2636778 RepID=UPI00382EF978
MIEILREIGMIARCLDSISNIEFKELHLSKGQYLYLVRICENPGIIQEKLSEMIKVDKTTVAHAVKKLEAQGFVEKKDDFENKKIKRLYPTEKGEDIYLLLKREEEHSDIVAHRGIDKEEAQAVLKTLKKIRRNIEIDWELLKKGEERKY